MKSLRWVSSFACLASLLVVAGCDSPGQDADDGGRDAGVSATDAKADGNPPDAEAGACALIPTFVSGGTYYQMPDASTIYCCCRFDELTTPACNAEGAVSCPAGYGLYENSDCTNYADGPCTNPSPEAGADAGDGGGDEHDASDAEAGTCEPVYDGDGGYLTPDASTSSCCCRGDVVAPPVCGAGGSLTCPASLLLYHGADCWSLGGPCSLPYPDSGPNAHD